MRKIAIMKCYVSWDDYSGDESFVGQHITEFSEVTDEEFAMLRAHLPTMGTAEYRYVIFEQVTDEELIPKTIADYKKVVAKRIAREKAAAEELAALKAEREAKKAARQNKSKKDQLRALAEELGVKIVAEQ